MCLSVMSCQLADLPTFAYNFIYTKFGADLKNVFFFRVQSEPLRLPYLSI